MIKHWTLSDIIEAKEKLDEQNVPKDGRYIRITEENLRSLSEQYHERHYNIRESRIMGFTMYVTPSERLIDVFNP